MKYINAEEIGVLGKGFPDAIGYRRLNEEDLATMTRLYPSYPGLPDSEAFPKVGRNSSGLHIDFRTDSRIIAVRWSVEYCDHPGNMDFVNQSGLDMYILLDGKYRYINSAIPTPGKKEGHEATLVNKDFGKVPQGKNVYTLELCTYDECTKLEIGIDDDAEIEAVPCSNTGYIAVYGTSITQGGCASRPGVMYTNLIRRALGEEIVNLGFSGAGILQHEMTEILCRLDPKVMIMDCVANMSLQDDEDYKDRWNYFYKRFRETHPNVPLLIIEKPNYAYEWTYQEGVYPQNRLLRELAEEWQDKNLYYIKGDNLYGDDYEGSVDGVHTTDLGFYRMTQIIQPVLEEILAKKPGFPKN